MGSRRSSVVALAVFAGAMFPSLGAAAAPPEGTFQATLSPPYTHFVASFSDPDAGDTLSYDWTGTTIECGSWQPGGPSGYNPASNEASWYHGGAPGPLYFSTNVTCNHDDGTTDANHVGTFKVTVTDTVGNQIVCTKSGPSSGPGTCQTVFPQCDDEVDNDGDGFIDLGDPGCKDFNDNDETDPPKIERSISIRFNDGTGARNNGLVVFGRLRSPDFPDCASGVPVNVQRRVDGRWVTKKRVVTNEEDRYRAEIPDVGNTRVRAFAPETVVIDGEGVDQVCEEAISPAQKP